MESSEYGHLKNLILLLRKKIKEKSDFMCRKAWYGSSEWHAGYGRACDDILGKIDEKIISEIK